MTESDTFEVIKNEETGAEVYQCTICSSKYGTKKAIRTHVTTKHKPKKKNDEKNEAAKDDDFVYEPVDETGDQEVDANIDIEEIARLYESGNNEYLDECDDKPEEEVTPSQAVPIDDTNERELVEKLMSELSDTPKDTATEDLFTENVLLKSKLKSVEATLKAKEQKILESETSLIDSNTEISKLKEEKEELEDSAKIKDEENEILIGTKNSLEENVARFDGIIKKMYTERTVMKTIIEKQKNTIGIVNDQSDDPAGLAVKLSDKMKELEQANKDKRRLAKELVEAQNNDKDIVDTEKCSKLTTLLKNQKGDTKKANEEVKRLTTSNKELQEKLNKVNNTNAVLETKTTRLEKQVEDLIETCGAVEKAPEKSRRVSFEASKTVDKAKTKCMFNDRGRCKNASCEFIHSNVVCKSFSKTAFCDNHDKCPMRHPEGVCLHWRRGRCEKESFCFYRHPEDELGIMKNDGSRTPDPKRKRTFSNHNNSTSPDRSSENHFLYQKVLELEKQLEAKNNPNQIRQEPVPRSKLIDRSDQYSRQSQLEQFQRTNVPEQFTRQVPGPSYYGPTVGPVQPIPVTSWGVSRVMPQWGSQEMYPGNQNM